MRPGRAAWADSIRGEQTVRHPRLVLFAAIALVCVAVFVVHRPALSAKALSFDDNQYLLDNPLVKNPSWYAAGRFLREVLRPSTVHGYYQPLSMISLMGDYAMGGRAENPRAFHRTSLGLHVANTALVTVLLYLLFGRVWVAALVGLLFGVHPLTVEPIPWIGERKTLLAAFFALGCLVLYMRYAPRPSAWVLAGCTVLFALALMSKPTSTPLPACLLLLDYWPLKRLGKRAVLEKLPLFILAGISALITFYSQKLTAHVRMPTETSPLRIPLLLCHNIVFYPYKMLWPGYLSSHYPIPDPLSLAHPMILAGVVGTVLLVAALLVSWRYTRAAVTGWAFFFLAIFPTLGVIGFNNVVASDKFAYLPSVGLLIALAGGLGWLWDRWESPAARRRVRSALVAAVVVLAACEAVGTRRHLRCWRDTETLYRHMLTGAPNSPWVHMDLANALSREGRFDDAVTHYRRAIAIRPGYAKFHYNLGITLWRRGDLDEAIHHCRRALELMPDYAKGHNGLGSLLSQKGQLEAAIRHYKKAIAIRPEYSEPYYNLANVHLRCGRNEQAISCYRQALRIRPSYGFAHFGLAMALERAGRIEGAVRHYEQAIRHRAYPQRARARLARLRDRAAAPAAGQKVVDSAGPHS